jgi:Bacterial Ig domain
MLCTLSRRCSTIVEINCLRRGAFLLASIAVLLGTALASRVDAQTTYTYTVIADLYNCSSAFAPALNNNGDVAFGADCGEPIGPLSSGIVIRRGNGGTLTDIFTFARGTNDSVVPHIDILSLNDSGVVAFGVSGPCTSGGGTAILTGDGATTNTVVDICTDPQYTSVIRPSINNSGAVAFMVDSDGAQGYDSVIRVSNGAFVTIAGPGTTPTSVGTLTAAFEPAINNNGLVTFTGQGTSAFGIFAGSGGAVTTISLDNPSTWNGINDSGRVAFVSNAALVQTGDGSAVTTVATISSTGYQSFVGAGAAINSAGKVAFLAYLPAGVQGVFTGPDPETDVVLKTGDVIPGFGTVTGISILREAINDSGQVAMTVLFDDNGVRKAAIIRADPPNRPPVASNGTASVTAGASVSGTLTASDPDGDALIYAIVADGSKGTAVVTNASTGAYTYTADIGASGDDTFTFQATDSHGLASNVATVTVSIQPPPACATNVTGSVAVTPGSLRRDKRTGHYFQKVTLKNTSSAAIAGPISFVLDSLTSGATLVNAAGVTSCAAPAGSPYVNVNVGSDSILSTRERANASLEFTLEFAGPGGASITYTPRVLAGSGGR